MKISNRDESITIIGHAAPMIEEYDEDANLQIKIGCIGIHMPHDDCPGLQVFTWMASQENVHISYGLAVVATEYTVDCAPIMSLDVDHEPSGQTTLGILLMPESVRALYARSENQSAVNKGLTAFGADTKEIKRMFGGLSELLRMENMNPDSGVLLFCPPMLALDMDLTGAPSMDAGESAMEFLSQFIAGLISVTEKLVAGDDDEDKMEALIRSMAAALKETGLMKNDGDEEGNVQLGLDARKFFAEHMN